MSARKCPKCGRVYTPKEYYKELFFKPVWGKWTCPECKTELTFNKRRRVLLSLVKLLWLYVLFLLKDVYEGEWLWYVFLIVFLVIGFALISLFDKFDEVN